MESEHTLLEQAKDGDREALNKLFYDRADQLSRFIKQRLPVALQDTVGVEDVRQETFRLAYLNIADFEVQHEGAFFGWLRTIALNQIKDAVKAQTRMKRGGEMSRVSATPSFGTDSINDLFADIAGSDVTATRKVAIKEAVEFLRVAVASLPENYREVLRLQYEEGKTYEEIGAAIGKSAQAVKGLLKRAKDRLQDDLGSASAYLSVR